MPHFQKEKKMSNNITLFLTIDCTLKNGSLKHISNTVEKKINFILKEFYFKYIFLYVIVESYYSSIKKNFFCLNFCIHLVTQGFFWKNKNLDTNVVCFLI